MKMVCGKFIQYDEMPEHLQKKFKAALEKGGFELGVSAVGKYYILHELEEEECAEEGVHEEVV